MKSLFIISGGPGKEHEVSRSSGKNISQLLLEAGILYDAIFITQEKRWVCGHVEMSEEEGIRFLKQHNALVFQCIHGTYGEDGELVSLLEESGVAYIGSSSSALRLTIDKYATEEILRSHGVRVPETVIITGNNLEEVTLPFSFPVIIKPRDEGSSISLYKVKDENTLRQIIKEELSKRSEIMVQECILGREVTCGVIEVDGELTALLPTEVVLTKGDMFDYQAKYTVGGCEEITPADVGEAATKRIKELALRVNALCGCKDISRTDMIMKENGELVVLEINTVPGMTKTSFIPAQLKASGYDMVQFVQEMMKKYE